MFSPSAPVPRRIGVSTRKADRPPCPTGRACVLCGAPPAGGGPAPVGRKACPDADGTVPDGWGVRPCAARTAAAAAHSEPAGRCAVNALPAGELGAVRHARRTVRYLLGAWEVADDLVDDLVLLTSELVTNAVVHAPPAPARPGTSARIWLALSYDRGTVTVSVIDSGPYDPRAFLPSLPDEDACCGRGLLLVAELSDRWGHAPHPCGTLVWAQAAESAALT